MSVPPFKWKPVLGSQDVSNLVLLVVHICNPGTPEERAAVQVQGQSGLLREKKKEKKRNEKERKKEKGK